MKSRIWYLQISNFGERIIWKREAKNAQHEEASKVHVKGALCKNYAWISKSSAPESAWLLFFCECSAALSCAFYYFPHIFGGLNAKWL